MIKKAFPVALSAIISLGLYAQRLDIELTFTAINNVSWVQLDSIKVMNRTQFGDTVLYWPDTVLMLNYPVAISESGVDNNGFQVCQNFPNPVKDRTTITLYVPENDQVNVIITDISGRVVIKTGMLMEKGYHSFNFKPGAEEVYFFTASWQEISSSIKIVRASPTRLAISALDYLGLQHDKPFLKSFQSEKGFDYSIGDKLLCIGYAGILQSGIPDNPENDESYTFQFAFNIPCPGTPTVSYEGKIYNTVQIFSQCWLQENLDIGSMIPGDEDMADNGTLEKYCYNDKEDSCALYGGLYQWDEMMQYAQVEGSRGICPPGWHIPSDEVWKVLNGTADSQNGIGDPAWDVEGLVGFDAGLNLKSAEGWYYGGGGTDQLGFAGLGGGARFFNGVFGNIALDAEWWSSTNYAANWFYAQRLNTGANPVYHATQTASWGLSVRCIMDY